VLLNVERFQNLIEVKVLVLNAVTKRVLVITHFFRHFSLLIFFLLKLGLEVYFKKLRSNKVPVVPSAVVFFLNLCLLGLLVLFRGLFLILQVYAKVIIIRSWVNWRFVHVIP